MPSDKIRFLHLTHDSLFLPFIYQLFEETPTSQNRWITISEPHNQLVHGDNLKRLCISSRDYYNSIQEAADIAWADCILIHFLHPMQLNLLKRIPIQKVVFWSGWGADYYSRMGRSEAKFLGTETQALLKTAENSWRARGRSLARFVEGKMRNRAFSAVVSRVDLFSSPIPEDYELMRLIFKDAFRAKFVQLNYGDVENTAAISSVDLVGHNILVGNSACETNNHMEAFHALRKCDLNGRKVIVPLSYGDENYRKLILQQGERIFGDRFVPLTNYMPLKKYGSIIGSCGFAIMNQKRQQALGNIIALLFQGSKVFFDPKNTVYRFFTCRDAVVNKVEDLSGYLGDGLTPLRPKDIATNKNMLHDFWGHDHVMGNVVRAIEVVREKLKVKRAIKHLGSAEI